MDTFKNFFQSTPRVEPKHRHESAFDHQPIDRKSTDFVPKYQQPKNDNIKVLNLKKGVSRIEFLTPQDVHEICVKFRCKMSPNEVVKLGNTGIKAYYQKGKPVISL